PRIRRLGAIARGAGMSPLLADIVGLIGSACIVGAYAYNNAARAVNALLYNVVNLLGAVLLCLSLTVHFNLASMLLEFVWSGVAIYGIVKAIRRKSEA
ncbi:MAG: hypothetical protein AB7U35_11275, partial [Sphingobium sp.]